MARRAACFPPRQQTHPKSAPYFTRQITSWLLPPLILALWRALVSAYIFSTLIYSLARTSLDGGATFAGRSFAYFTNLTYWGLGFYFAVSACHGLAYYVRRGPAGLSRDGHYDNDDRDGQGHGQGQGQRLKHVLRWTHGAYYATVTVYPIIVTVVAWTLLLKGALYDRYSTWLQLSVHALNTLFAGLEIILPRTEPLAWIFLVPVVVLLAMYLALTYVSHAVTGEYVYPFLDVQRHGSGVVAGVIIGILVAVVVVFAVVHLAIRLRLWITEDKLGMKGKLIHGSFESGKHGSGRATKAAG